MNLAPKGLPRSVDAAFGGCRQARSAHTPGATYHIGVWTAIVILLVIWAVLAVVGFVFEGLLWLAVVGLILFVGTLIIGIIRQRIRRSG